ncbi:MAG: SMP-30/gluconolactonase/LRE family protein [Cyclobacteriaceae bacterium]
MIKTHSVWLFVLLMTACAPKTEIITIQERELIPEGITVGEDGEIYLSNIYAKNITMSKSDGSDAKVIETMYTGKFSGVGITRVNGKLYQVSNSDDQSVFQIIDSKTGNLLESYLNTDTIPSFLNDLAISRDGKAYITDSNQNRIFTVRNNSLVVFLESDEIKYPNGIALSDDEQLLFIASFTKGIRIYDVLSNKFVNEADTSNLTRAIDGLKYYKNSLIGIQNASRNLAEHCVVRFYLNDKQTMVTQVDTLIVNHPTFNIPTTFDVQGGWVYCLANSQLENLDQETMELINEEELTDTFILKFKVE